MCVLCVDISTREREEEGRERKKKEEKGRERKKKEEKGRRRRNLIITFYSLFLFPLFSSLPPPPFPL
jgi:hypothetical protein